MFIKWEQYIETLTDINHHFINSNK